MKNQKLSSLLEKLEGEDWNGNSFFLDLDDEENPFLSLSVYDVPDEKNFDIYVYVSDEGKYEIIKTDYYKSPKSKKVKSETLSIFWIKKFLEPRYENLILKPIKPLILKGGL